MTVEVKKESNRPANGGVPAVLLPKINLGLGIGTNSVRNQNRNIPMVCWQGVPVLTISQMNELQQQVLIHKHLVAGLRVPTNLLVPIWKSVARTGCSDFDERHRSFVRFSPLGFDNGHMMDPEPGRCRRTDGKKWRCSRNIVPHQKYCERHMHRGRGRRCSRKPVETSETNSPSKTTLVNKTDREVGYVAAAPATTTSKRNKPANHFSCHIPAAITFPLITESIITSPKMVTEIVTSSTHPTSTKATHTSCVDATKTVTMVPACAPITIAPHVTTVPSSITSCTIDLKDVCNMNCGEKYSKNQNDFRRNGLNVQKIPSPGFGFSPNSVLQGCSSSCYNSKINIELEPGRCRRTDGKRWRCRREIIPNHKYCGMHMHRGSKKHFKSSEKVANLATSAASSSGITLLPLSMTPLAKAETTTLNTNLSMSIRAGDKQKHEEESNVSCSSETTITDTTITACENTSS